MDRLSLKPEIILTRERQRWQKGVFLFLALGVALTTVILLINPATTEEYKPICGVEEHEHDSSCFETVNRLVCERDESPGHVHGDECYEIVENCVCGFEDDPEHEHTDDCFEEERILICELPENEVHEHTEDCIEWREELVCENTDPEHEHTEECWKRIPVFICEEVPGVGHVHNEFCYLEEEVLTCSKEAHIHTDACYPKLKGDPHADVFTEQDWESTFCTVKLSGDWAEDLIAIAESQLGYGESERNFVTDEYNVQHGYTYYGDWYGVRYASWNALYPMFCMHYAEIWGVPTDSVPANWMNSARAKEEFWIEADGEPKRGDLVFFDDNADGLGDRVAIVTEVSEDSITAIWGGPQTEVHYEDFARDFANITGYLSLPENPDAPVPDDELLTLKAEDAESEEEIADETVPLAAPAVVLTAETPDGMTVTLYADADSLPYPADELSLTAEAVDTAYYAEEMGQIEDAMTEEGRTVTGALLYDITVWRTETLTIPEEPEESEESENSEETENAGAEEEAEIRTVKLDPVAVQPEGSFEIEIKGLGADGGTNVWHFGESGMEELAAKALPDGMTFRVWPE